MNDEQILQRGGDEEDIRKYAEQNGASLTQEPMEWDKDIISILDQKYVDKEWVVAELNSLIWLEVRKVIKQAEERERERIVKILKVYEDVDSDIDDMETVYKLINQN